MVLSYYVVFNTCQYTELTLNSYVKLVCIVNNLLCESYVLLVGEV